jgi:hypothetical protein
MFACAMFYAWPDWEDWSPRIVARLGGGVFYGRRYIRMFG